MNNLEAVTILIGIGAITCGLLGLSYLMVTQLGAGGICVVMIGWGFLFVHYGSVFFGD